MKLSLSLSLLCVLCLLAFNTSRRLIVLYRTRVCVVHLLLNCAVRLLLVPPVVAQTHTGGVVKEITVACWTFRYRTSVHCTT
jgi:hypothetical protein